MFLFCSSLSSLFLAVRHAIGATSAAADVGSLDTITTWLYVSGAVQGEIMTIKDEAPPVLTVDARGHRCPVPTLRLRRALEPLRIGQAAAILADDPLARIDLPHFAVANGHRLVELVDCGDHIRAVIRKGDPADRR